MLNEIQKQEGWRHAYKDVDTDGVIVSCINRVGICPTNYRVPIVLQNMGVMLVAMLLPTRPATITIGMLLALAALGLPVLTGGRGGIAVFMGPTAGFMYGWLLTPLAYAGITHFLKRDFWLTKAIGMTFGGVLLTELLGALWLTATTSIGFVPAILSVLIDSPGDLLNMALTVLVVQQLTAVIPALRQN